MNATDPSGLCIDPKTNMEVWCPQMPTVPVTGRGGYTGNEIAALLDDALVPWGSRSWPAVRRSPGGYGGGGGGGKAHNGQLRRIEQYGRCIAGEAADNGHVLNTALGNWGGAALGLVGWGVKKGAGILVSQGLKGSGLATSSTTRLALRWLLYRSAGIEQLNPLVVQGIRVGMVDGTQALSGTAVVAGGATNVAAGILASIALGVGTGLGSIAVGLHRCNF